MKGARIMILKATLDRSLAEEYGVEHLGVCSLMRQGQVFYVDYTKPGGFYDEARKAAYQYVFALAHGTGSDVLYYGDWTKTLGVIICGCNDGLRPVTTKSEATKEIA